MKSIYWYFQKLTHNFDVIIHYSGSKGFQIQIYLINDAVNTNICIQTNLKVENQIVLIFIEFDP